VKLLLSAIAVAPLALLLTSCARDINNKEALRSAVVEHLTARQSKIGLDMTHMDVDIGSMSFQKDQATATVSFKPKGGGDGMTIPYAFERKGDKWVVKAKMEAGPGGHGAGGMPIPESAPGGAGALPPGHPATGAAMPAGHPPVAK